jgi:hypothetical protein
MRAPQRARLTYRARRVTSPILREFPALRFGSARAAVPRVMRGGCQCGVFGTAASGCSRRSRGRVAAPQRVRLRLGCAWRSLATLREFRALRQGSARAAVPRVARGGCQCGVFGTATSGCSRHRRGRVCAREHAPLAGRAKRVPVRMACERGALRRARARAARVRPECGAVSDVKTKLVIALSAHHRRRRVCAREHAPLAGRAKRVPVRMACEFRVLRRARARAARLRVRRCAVGATRSKWGC